MKESVDENFLAKRFQYLEIRFFLLKGRCEVIPPEMCSGEGVLQEAWYSAEVCSRHGRGPGLTTQAWLPPPVSIFVFIFTDWTTPLHMPEKIHIMLYLFYWKYVIYKS